MRGLSVRVTDSVGVGVHTELLFSAESWSQPDTRHAHPALSCTSFLGRELCKSSKLNF